MKLLSTNLDPPQARMSLIVALTLRASSFLFTTSMGMTIGSKAGICILGIPDQQKEKKKQTKKRIIRNSINERAPVIRFQRCSAHRWEARVLRIRLSASDICPAAVRFFYTRARSWLKKKKKIPDCDQTTTNYIIIHY